MTAGSVNDKIRSGRPFTSRSAEMAERVLEMFVRNLQKPLPQGARKKTFNTLRIAQGIKVSFMKSSLRAQACKIWVGIVFTVKFEWCFC